MKFIVQLCKQIFEIYNIFVVIKKYFLLTVHTMRVHKLALSFTHQEKLNYFHDCDCRKFPLSNSESQSALLFATQPLVARRFYRTPVLNVLTLPEFSKLARRSSMIQFLLKCLLHRHWNILYSFAPKPLLNEQQKYLILKEYNDMT